MTHEGETVPPLRVVREDLVARLRNVVDLFNNPRPLSAPWARETAAVICMREAADRIEEWQKTSCAKGWQQRAEQAEARLARVREYCERERDAVKVFTKDLRYSTTFERILALLDEEAK